MLQSSAEKKNLFQTRWWFITSSIWHKPTVFHQRRSLKLPALITFCHVLREAMSTLLLDFMYKGNKNTLTSMAHCANIVTVETAHRLLDRILPFFSRDAAWDATCADLVILVGRFKALVQRKRMMKATFVWVQGEAEVKETAVGRAGVRM